MEEVYADTAYFIALLSESDDLHEAALRQARRLRDATGLYADRRDKEWSGVDCMSMVVMADRGIDEILTHDHHFEQAGKHILL